MDYYDSYYYDFDISSKDWDVLKDLKGETKDVGEIITDWDNESAFGNVKKIALLGKDVIQTGRTAYQTLKDIDKTVENWSKGNIEKPKGIYAKAKIK
jgi:hypothetical protein